MKQEFGAKIIRRILLILLIFFIIKLWDSIILGTEIGIKCCTDYSVDYYLKRVLVDNEEKSIFIDIRTSVNPNRDVELTARQFEKIYEIVFEKEKYEDYILTIEFKALSKDTYARISNINSDNSETVVYGRFTIPDVLKICPNVASIAVYTMEYDSLEIFKEFSNLKELECLSDYIDIYEKNYILELFPECELKWVH